MEVKYPMPHKAPEEDQPQKDGNLAGNLILDQVHAIKMLVGFDISFQVLPTCILFPYMHCCASQGLLKEGRFYFWKDPPC